MRGKTREEVDQDLSGLDFSARAKLAPHKVFPGNRPTNSFLINLLTPATLGALIGEFNVMFSLF